MSEGSVNNTTEIKESNDVKTSYSVESSDWSWKVTSLNIVLGILGSYTINSNGSFFSESTTSGELPLYIASALGFVVPALVTATIAYFLTLKTKCPRKVAVICFWVVTATSIMGTKGISIAGGNSTYDDCILGGMRGVKSDVAAKSIRTSCRKKYPKPKPIIVELPHDALKKLDGSAGSKSGGNFGGEIYNGNSDWIINKLLIRITDKKTNKYKDYETTVYTGTAPFLIRNISPLSKGTFTIEPFKLPNDMSWYIKGGTGYIPN